VRATDELAARIAASWEASQRASADGIDTEAVEITI
jgi:hypothetical protein